MKVVGPDGATWRHRTGSRKGKPKAARGRGEDLCLQTDLLRQEEKRVEAI